MYRLGLVIVIVCGSGCVIVDDDIPVEHIGKTVELVESDNQLSTNSLSANRLSANRLSANRLSANRLSATRLALNALGSDGMEGTPDGREVLAYIARCALPAGEVLEAEVDEVVYQFPGVLGLAPAWESNALSAGEKRWMSACLLAHCNYYGVSVAISLRGAHPALSASAAERAAFPVQDGVFYGDLFGGTPLKFACEGDDQYTGTPSASLSNRVCSREDVSAPGSTYCGFAAVGMCRAQVANAPHACANYAGGEYYESCYPVASSDGWTGGDTPYVEVITAFVSAD